MGWGERLRGTRKLAKVAELGGRTVIGPGLHLELGELHKAGRDPQGRILSRSSSLGLVKAKGESDRPAILRTEYTREPPSYTTLCRGLKGLSNKLRTGS